ncbi:MAG TPA: ABC transporter ATP-binding protein [Egibacteraceae bacterium]|nr:ABC transporter ATP-binding protein [Egibacteraceae bacterium]
MAAGEALRAEGLAVGYRARRHERLVLDGLDVALRPGRLTCLLGPNGSGKSTLLRTLAGMQAPLAGRALLGGQDVHRLAAMERARRLAVVLTDQVDAGTLRVEDLVALGRHPHTGWSGRLTARDADAVSAAITAVDAGHLRGRMVSELSDGERQRVLIARALAQQPRVMALDEPLAFVDVPRRVELTQLLRRLAREADLAILLTTHDLDLALRFADDLWLLDGARLLRGGPEDLVLSGAVARAFAAQDVSFDLERGAFLPVAAPRAVARVHGSGAGAVWLARALERAGLRVASPDDPRPAAFEAVELFQGGFGLEVAAGPDDGGSWSEHPTIESLLETVEAALRRAGPAPGSGGCRPRAGDPPARSA